jgi:hypothetical protein
MFSAILNSAVDSLVSGSRWSRAIYLDVEPVTSPTDAPTATGSQPTSPTGSQPPTDAPTFGLVLRGEDRAIVGSFKGSKAADPTDAKNNAPKLVWNDATGEHRTYALGLGSQADCERVAREICAFYANDKGRPFSDDNAPSFAARMNALSADTRAVMLVLLPCFGARFTGSFVGSFVAEKAASETAARETIRETAAKLRKVAATAADVSPEDMAALEKMLAKLGAAQPTATAAQPSA